MQDPAPTPLIFSVIPKIIGEIAVIGKDRKNPAQGYKFRGIDDVYSALNPLLAKYGVTICPKVIWHSFTRPKIGKDNKESFRCEMHVEFTVYASDGSHISFSMLGEGMDFGDKTVGKAHSTAYKYGMFQLFCIPTEERADTEEQSWEAPPAEEPAPEPARLPMPPGYENAPQHRASTIDASTLPPKLERRRVEPTAAPLPVSTGPRDFTRGGWRNVAGLKGKTFQEIGETGIKWYAIQNNGWVNADGLSPEQTAHRQMLVDAARVALAEIAEARELNTEPPGGDDDQPPMD